jgi:hypothetical protein
MEYLVVIVGGTMASISHLLEAMWVFQWKIIGWKIGIYFCAAYVVFEFLPGPHPRSELERFAVVAAAFLALLWFLLPKVKKEFRKHDLR